MSEEEVRIPITPERLRRGLIRVGDRIERLGELGRIVAILERNDEVCIRYTTKEGTFTEVDVLKIPHPLPVHYPLLVIDKRERAIRLLEYAESLVKEATKLADQLIEKLREIGRFAEEEEMPEIE